MCLPSEILMRIRLTVKAINIYRQIFKQCFINYRAVIGYNCKKDYVNKKFPSIAKVYGEIIDELIKGTYDNRYNYKDV